jgi:hypothetical protein
VVSTAWGIQAAEYPGYSRTSKVGEFPRGESPAEEYSCQRKGQRSNCDECARIVTMHTFPKLEMIVFWILNQQTIARSSVGVV